MVSQIKKEHFLAEIKHFFRKNKINNQTLTIHYQDQRDCVFIETNQNDISEIMLPEGVETAFILYDNTLYYQDARKGEKTCLQELSSKGLLAIKNLINCQSLETPSLLLESQVNHLCKMTNYSRQIPFLELNNQEEAFKWKYSDENVWREDNSDSLPAVLSALYPKLSQMNHSKKANALEKQILDNAFTIEMPEKKWWQWLSFPFSALNKTAKAIIRFLVVDNIIFKYTIGALIAKIANFGNSHYRTPPGTLSDILGRIIFPGGSTKPILNQDKSLTFGPVLSRHFFALRKAEWHENRFLVRDKYNQEKIIDFKEFTLKMPNDTLVSSVTAANELAKTVEPNQKIYIIAFNGNNGCYQSEMANDAYLLQQYEDQELPVELIRFNYPGVLHSNGVPTTSQIVEAGIAQVERLLDQGVSPEQIQLHGTSLGGSISSHVAHFYHARGETLGALCVSRTFSSTSNVGVAYVKKIPYVGSLLGFLFRPMIAFGLWATQWQLDTAKKFSQIPDNRAWYTVARSPKELHLAYASRGKTILDDTVLMYESSLHKSWRIQWKHRLAKYFGLFGFNKHHYQEMNSAHKLITTVDQELSPNHCAHSEGTSFGAVYQIAYPELAVGVQNQPKPKLLVRDKYDLYESNNIKTAIEDENGSIDIPSSLSLGEQNIQFTKEQYQKQRDIQEPASYFGQFFKPQRSKVEKAASAMAQMAINLIP